jgi:hypothetical protein
MSGVHAFNDGLVDRLHKGLQGLVGSAGITRSEVVEGEGRLAQVHAEGGGSIEVGGQQYEPSGSYAATQGQRSSGECLGLLAPEAPRHTGGLDSGLFDGRDGSFKLVGVGVGGADRDEPGGPEDAVAGGEVGLLLEHVLILGGLLCVLDLAEPLTLGGVGDVLGLLPDVA